MVHGKFYSILNLEQIDIRNPRLKGREQVRQAFPVWHLYEPINPIYYLKNAVRHSGNSDLQKPPLKCIAPLAWCIRECGDIPASLPLKSFGTPATKTPR